MYLGFEVGSFASYFLMNYCCISLKFSGVRQMGLNLMTAIWRGFGESYLLRCETVHTRFSQNPILWGLQIPSILKYFAWRDCKNILPSLSNLQKRGIVFDDSCEECRDEGDSSGHFFWRCPCSALIWSHKAIFYAINRPRFLDFMDITCYGFY